MFGRCEYLCTFVMSNKHTHTHISIMGNQNFKLKSAQRQWIIKVDSTAGSRNFYIPTLKPSGTAFWFHVGQFIQKHEIKSVKYIGRHMTYDHWGNDTEEIFETINRKFPTELIEAFNAEWK